MDGERPIPAETDGDLGETVQWVFHLLLRHRVLILGVTCAVAVLSIAVLYRLPNRYTSEATLIVLQQQVPERYVVSTSSTDMNRYLDAMTQEVLSRTRLVAIIDELGLYQKARKRLPEEQVVQLMRKEVGIAPIQSSTERREVNAFKISFTADNPQVSREVTSRLTSLFIEQNLRTRADQAEATTRFLHEQLVSAKATLDDREQRLRDFKMQHLGELPEQQQGNLGILTGFQSQLDNVMSNRNRAQQQRLYVESLLSEYRRLASRRSAPGGTVAPNGQLVTPEEAAQRDLARLEEERRTLLGMYTQEHPDIRKKDREIALQQALVQRLRNAPKPSPEAARSPAGVSEAPEDGTVVAQLRSQLEATNLELENLSKTEQKLKADIEQYRARLNLTPVREQQLNAMQRECELLRQHYSDLLKKEQESQLATSLEKQQEGQQFRLIDPPSLPALPSSPKRLKMSGGAVAVGLLIGLAAAFLLEKRKNCFYAESEISMRFRVPLSVGVPLLLTPAEKRWSHMRVALQWGLSSVFILVVAAAELYVYRHG